MDLLVLATPGAAGANAKPMTPDLSALQGWTLAFDLDGTLVDTAPDLAGTMNALLVQEGVPTLSLDEVRPMIGRGARALLERGFAAAGQSVSAERLDALLARFIDHYRGRIADESRPFAELEPALDALERAGAILSVCTNKPTDLSFRLLKALGLDHRFRAIVGGDKAAAPKPDAAHLLTAIEAAGGDAKKAIMVGDSATDVGAARAAGAPVILVSFGYTDTPARDLGADTVIDDFAALPNACAALVACAEGRN